MNRSEYDSNRALHATLKRAEQQRNAQPGYLVVEGLALAEDYVPQSKRTSGDPRNSTGRKL